MVTNKEILVNWYNNKTIKTLFPYLKNQKTFSIKSDGSSMMSILRPNDIVHYRKMPFRQAKINELIMVTKNSHLFTHRIIYKTPDYLITKDDNNLEFGGKNWIYSISIRYRIRCFYLFFLYDVYNQL